MSQTLTISDTLYSRLEQAAREHGFASICGGAMNMAAKRIFSPGPRIR